MGYAAVGKLEFVTGTAILVGEAVVADVVDRGAALRQVADMCVVKVAAGDGQASDGVDIQVVVVTVGPLVVGELAVLHVEFAGSWSWTFMDPRQYLDDTSHQCDDNRV
jgi:hypothetical protein